MSTPSSPQLEEKDFIHEEYSKNPFPFWLWLFLVTVVTCLIWGGISWYQKTLSWNLQTSPFLQVTNRQISLFLWQFSDFMRANSANKTGYLPGFLYKDKISLDLPFGDEYAVAPPELIFLYHTWDRLISKEALAPRPIPIKEFREFLNYAEEWKPQYWPAAPEGYVLFSKSLETTKEENLETLPESSLPFEVRLAFQGWKNYFKEGTLINQVKPTYEEMQNFLNNHPHYARNYWRNIVEKDVPEYLKTLTSGKFEPHDAISNKELAPFLKVAFFNDQQALKSK